MRGLALAFALVLVACQSGAAVGTTCVRDSECASPLACRFGRCRTECVAQRDCPLGATCLLDQDGLGSCSLLDDPDCTSTSCEAPLACVGRECVNVCMLGPECPAGSACVPIGDGRARCVRTDGEDAGLGDAGTDAAADASFDAGQDAGPSLPPPHDASLDAFGACSPRVVGAGPCDTAIDVVVDDRHSCVRSTQGHVWCWGEGPAIGRDGDDTFCSGIACPTPELLRAGDGAAADASDVERVLLSDYGGCYTTHTTGLMYCWGTHDYEAPLGTEMIDGPRARTVHDAAHSPIMNTDTFAVFGESAIAADIVSGHWLGWGTDRGDVLDRGSIAPSLDVAVDLGVGWVDVRTVASGGTHACGITSDGHPICWGSNTHGESAPAAVSATVAPTVIMSVSGVTELTMGLTHSCALASGHLVCWGLRESLPGASGCTSTNCAPTTIDTGSLVVAHVWPVSDADDFCASDVAGHLSCWGGGYGSFGASSPTPVPSLPPIASAWLSWSHGCAIDTNSQTWCWGHNEVGQLGIGVPDLQSHAATPVAFP